MNDIINNIESIKSEISKYVKKRLTEFKKLGKNNLTKYNFKPFMDIEEFEADIFSEACFCILTANSSAKLGIKIQKDIGIEGFRKYTLSQLTQILKKHGHRFAKQRAERIIKLRKQINFIYNIIKEKDVIKIRKKLVENIYGYGYKESSHFLRNIGFSDVAIIDRHILRYLIEHKLVEPRKTITPRAYIEAENALKQICTKLNIKQAELDLYIFYAQTKVMLK